MATAVAASLIAAGFALYALLEPMLGRPGSAAIVALIFALVAVIIALVLTRRPSRRQLADDAADQGLGERLIEIARTKPMLAAGAAAAAGLIAWRNPALVGIIVTALMKKPDRPPR